MSISDPTLGEITLFAGNFAPRGWAFCDGTILSIDSYPSLFAIVGTTYGGDGRMTFRLPDMRGHLLITNGMYRGLPVHQVAGCGTDTELKAGGITDLNTATEYVAATLANDAEVFGDDDPLNRLNYIIAVTGIFPSR